MLREKLSYLGETLNGKDIADNLKRVALNTAGFIVSYKTLVEISKPSGNLPDELTPFVIVPIIFLAEITRQIGFPLFNRVVTGDWPESVLNNIDKLTKKIHSR